MPSRTLSPRISTTVMMMSLLITMLSFFFLDRTSMAVYPSEVLGPTWRDAAGTNPPVRDDCGPNPHHSPGPLTAFLAAVHEPGGAFLNARRTVPICPR